LDGEGNGRGFRFTEGCKINMGKKDWFVRRVTEKRGPSGKVPKKLGGTITARNVFFGDNEVFPFTKDGFTCEHQGLLRKVCFGKGTF